ncbi:TRAP transporter substrate-binding protein [Chelatococcus asaccharovorans]|uniref:TRAP transporter substrate-binding protein n=1 Tax=Chelatococcus asaccharovorans TaxID=28210 RepID=UPI00224C6A13|nr:TRAP transporter substrate-binding protein DctP [Chelatococcus asaccharovorans]CAH1665255.1 TRAP-type C4-dicarboxylate transport system substrate-binding protein [Chelatococcus asaccharovorans]CAH1682040.1 TRAP-type C4-dicarboxylate transport system substrate-binding protein [Chelatococcus asaccharovorans]
MRAIAIVLTALLAGTLAAEARELRLGAAPPPASPWGVITQKFVDRVAEVSGGELEIKAYMGGKLGAEQDVAKQIARGRIDMGVMSNSAVSLLVPSFGLLTSPYAFDSAEQFDCVADNHLLDTFGEEFDGAGIVTLSWMEVGYQSIFSQKDMRLPSDLAGVKIRTAPSVTDTLFIKEAGGTAVPLDPNDVIPAMKTGQVNAATQLSVFGIVSSYDKVAPNIVLTRHQHQVGAIIMSKRTWNKLSDEEKGWINEAAPVFLELREAIRGAEVALLKKVADEGANVIELSNKELDAWRALAPAAQKQILDELGGKAQAKWNAILAAKSACTQN